MSVLDALTKVAKLATKARAGELFDAAGKFAKLSKNRIQDSKTKT